MRSRSFTLLLSLSLVTGVATAAAPDLSTPQAARRAYDRAMHDGDAAAAKAAAIYDAKWEGVIDSGAAADAAMARLRKAAADRWGAAAKGVFPELRVDDLPETTYQVTGDTAALKFRGSTVVRRFRKENGQWKVDFLTPITEGFPDDPAGMIRSSDAYGRAAAAIAEQVAAGKFASPQAAHKAFDDLNAVLYDPSAATTRPGAIARPATRTFASTRLAASQPVTPAQYVKAGIPPLDQAWQGREYARAAQVLTKGDVPLPRFDDPAGRAVLDRVGSPQNFAAYRDVKRPAQARMEDYLQFQRELNAIFKLYLVADRAGQDVNTELTYLLAYTLRTNAVGIELIDDVIAALPRTDPKYADRVKSLKSAGPELTGPFIAAENILGTLAQKPEERMFLLAALDASLPVMKNLLPPDYRAQLPQKLKNYLAASVPEPEAAHLRRMLAELAK